MQSWVVGMWLPALPVLMLPSWQDTQLPEMPAWLNIAPLKVVVLKWQSAQSWLSGVVGM
jgi:hypothetical protein